jgi:hypothetical protein
LFRKVKRKTLFAFTIYELYFHVVIWSSDALVFRNWQMRWDSLLFNVKRMKANCVV